MSFTKTCSLSGVIAALLIGASATAQVSYFENFDATDGSWTSVNYGTGLTACGGAGGVIRENFYFASSTWNMTSPLTGTSLGGSIALSFDYKVADWSANDTGSIGWGSFDVQSGPTASGPWTTVATVTDADDVQDGSTCFTKTATFSPGAGDLYLNVNWTYGGGGSGDYYGNIDNVSLVETVTACGTPAPGDTLASVPGACSGIDFTLSVQNATSGSGVSQQWYSSIDSGTTWVAGGTGATETGNQTVDTWYRCDVTCSTGPTTVASNVLMLAMATTTWPNGFDTDVTDNCWSVVAGTGADVPLTDPTSAFGVGTNSVMYDFYSITGGDDLTHVSPEFAPVAAGTSIYFDVAGKQYNTAVDTVNLEESNDGGLTWTLIAAMTNDPVTGVLNTVGTGSFPEFHPAANEWASLAFALTAGTNRVQFRAVSDFGNNCYIDNISVGVIPSARHTAYGAGCGAPMVLSSATAPIDDAVVTYDVDGSPELFPAAGISAGVVIVDFTQVFPGTNISPLLDADCLVYVQDLTLLLDYVSLLGSTASVVLDLPAGVPAGTLIYAQAAALMPPTATNLLGFQTSNGLRSNINTF